MIYKAVVVALLELGLHLHLWRDNLVEHNKLLNKLKTLVNNKRQWVAFNDYIDWMIMQQQATLEQTDNSVIFCRAQGSISTLRKIKQLKDEVNSHG